MNDYRLSYQDVQPQMEPLYFLYDAKIVPEPMAAVMDQIKQLAEQMLYHWKTFPITLPYSITDTGWTDGQSTQTPGDVIFQKLFIAPTFDELAEVAQSPAGGQKLLDKSQLNSIWNNGEFEVASINFPGQTHRWRLTQLLQKGSNRARETLLNDVALALRLLMITARNRFSSHFFSVSQSVKGFGRGLWKLLDIFIGMPSTSPGDLEYKIHEDHMQYLIAELSIKPNSETEYKNFCKYIKDKCQELRRDHHKTSDFHPPPVPYSYQTPTGLDIDLRLFNKDLINNCLPILSNILDREAKGWHMQFRQKLISELKGTGKGLSNEEISSKVEEAILQEYTRRVFTAVQSNAELESLQQGIGSLLIAQAQSVFIMEKAAHNVQKKMKIYKQQLVDHLKKQYTVKSRIQAWMNKQLRLFEEDFVSLNLWSAHEEAISMCEEENLTQTLYFLKRDLNFIKERETILIKELSKVKIPNRVFTFATKIWFPHNWIVHRHNHQTEVIPTIILENKPIKTSPSKKEPHISYTLGKYYQRNTSTCYPFWRWWNYLHRNWAWMWNSIFFFGVMIPWCSAVSLRALFLIRPFLPDLEVSQLDGIVYPRESSCTQTLCSRLVKLWENVRLSRSEFEDAPDTGFLGKSFARHLNRVWNYVLKGAVGSLLLIFVFPTLCITASTLSIVVAVTAPVWTTLATFAAHLACVFIFDFDCPDENSNRLFLVLDAILWKILLQGCVQPVAAALFGCLFCPLAAFTVTMYGLSRRGLRGLWDIFMFHVIIKSRGRVPIQDGFVARRVAGPGLASEYFFQIHPEQSLAAFEARLELDELEAWKATVRAIIEKPKEQYLQFFQECLSPFSAEVVMDGVYKSLCAETDQYLTDLMNKVQERERKLNLGLHPDVQGRIKLSEKDLKSTIAQASKMLKDFYPEHVLRRLPKMEKEFWEMKHLEYRDWRGLACKKLSEIFSKSFLSPLEETDNYFEVEHLNLVRYMKMLSSADYHDDLDIVTEINSNPGEVHIRPPVMDCGYFNPNHRVLSTARYHTPRDRLSPWKRVWQQPSFDKLEVPLRIPHSAVIAVSIYNRENDQNLINIDDVFCQRILRAMKEAPYVNMSESHNVDVYDNEPSTPDHILNPTPTLSHLAEQELSFTDDEMNAITLQCEPKLDETTPTAVNDNENHGKTVYSEKEHDNSCVVSFQKTDIDTPRRRERKRNSSVESKSDSSLFYE